jgi:hypothetical protein
VSLREKVGTAAGAAVEVGDGDVVVVGVDGFTEGREPVALPTSTARGEALCGAVWTRSLASAVVTVCAMRAIPVSEPEARRFLAGK